MNKADIRVLLVDDEEMIRDSVSAYLEDEGFSVYCTASAEEALESIVSISPVVCISDLRLPGMDGEKFIVRAYDLCPSTIFMLHTGMLYILSDELRAIGMTADDVLLKPIHDLSRLVDKIRNLATVGRSI